MNGFNSFATDFFVCKEKALGLSTYRNFLFLVFMYKNKNLNPSPQDDPNNTKLDK
jgi:hypothetical protein